MLPTGPLTTSCHSRAPSLREQSGDIESLQGYRELTASLAVIHRGTQRWPGPRELGGPVQLAQGQRRQGEQWAVGPAMAGTGIAGTSLH